MVSIRLRKVFVPVVVSLSLMTVACAPEPPSRYDQVQKETSQKGSSAVSKEAINGSKLNRYFPKSGSGFAVVPSQEKKGFAEHKVSRGGKNVAVLSINDTISNPSAAEKYQQSSVKIGGFPAVEQGQNGTGVLVGDRFQVKAQSRDPSFTKQDRAAWIQKFDLNGLSTLK
ncbi:MAG: hypothetical protein IGS48_16570 [Oscillatoriales cyanobacterium C42_A2020_001]|nr:hypothetical protein [Leptolyngbyaceae cyanobacterium C42_A2020_001]